MVLEGNLYNWGELCKVYNLISIKIYFKFKFFIIEILVLGFIKFLFNGMFLLKRFLWERLYVYFVKLEII